MSSFAKSEQKDKPLGATKSPTSFLERAAVTPAAPDMVPPIVHEVLRSPGQPLDVATRAFMEPRFGQDFSQVRVHTDAKAAESAKAVNALAYTVGRNVVFGAGQYQPQSNEGRKLIAHELAHVLQCRKLASDTIPMSINNQFWENDAEQAQNATAAGQNYKVSFGAPTALYMRPDPRLAEVLEQIKQTSRTIPVLMLPKLKSNRIFEIIHSVDLSQPENLDPIVLTILNTFHDSDGQQIVDLLLERIHLQQGKGNIKKEEEESPGILATIGGGLLGEWNEDPAGSMIFVDMVASLIPGLDQISDARDLAAHLYFMTAKDEYKKPLRWVSLVFSLFGMVPEIGSAIKSASKYIITGALKKLDEMLQLVRKFMPTINNLEQFWRKVIKQWPEIVTRGMAIWNNVVAQVRARIGRIPVSLSERLHQIREALEHVHEQSIGRLQEAFEHVRGMINEMASRFMPELATPVGSPASTFFSQNAKAEQKATGTTMIKESTKAGKKVGIIVRKVEYGSTDLGQLAIEYRKIHHPKGGNVAVFEYIDKNGVRDTVRAYSIEGSHAERLADRALEALEVDPKQVTRIYSELEPCIVPGGKCAHLLSSKYINASIEYSFEYGDDISRRIGIKERNKLLKKLGLMD